MTGVQTCALPILNAIRTLRDFQESAEKVNSVRVNFPPRDSTYKQIRGYLLEAQCWLDMEDMKQAGEVIKKVVSANRKRKSHDESPFLPKEIIDELNLLVEEEPNNNASTEKELWKKSKLKEIFSRRPNLQTDAIKLILQYNSEEWRSHYPEADEDGEQYFEEAEKRISELKAVIAIHADEPFQRQNLKELALNWLEALSRIKKGHFAIQSSGWRKAVTTVTACLNEGPPSSEACNFSYEQPGDIANEIWGDTFKKFPRTTREKLFMLLSDLTDGCEKFFHDDAIHKPSTNGGSCNHNDERIFLGELTKFELKAHGMEICQDKNDVCFQNQMEETRKDIYPCKDTYEHRRALRRGRVLRKYIRYAEGGENKKCQGKSKCFPRLTKDWAWLDRECTSGNEAESAHVCLERVLDAWNNGEDADGSVLKLKDYKKIIGNSDYETWLHPGRSKQPTNLYNNVTGVEFVALRRWNSYTPELSFSKGGGYFVFVPVKSKANESSDAPGGTFRETRLGVVIDPGFDFIHNFFSQGFTLDDIDVVLITHADPDHINDFGGLADLLREREKRGEGKFKKIYTFMPRNAQKILKRFISDGPFRNLYYDTILVDAYKDLEESGAEITDEVFHYTLFQPEAEQKPETPCMRVEEKKDLIGADDREGLWLTIKPIEASHDDHAGGQRSSYGYVLKFEEKKTNSKKETLAVVGFTGDSQWFPAFAPKFKDCHLVCSHMGSVLGDKAKSYNKKGGPTIGGWEALIRKKNHPYLPGEILFLEQLRKLDDVPEQRIVVLSEFGEEMKGQMRRDICERLNRCLGIGGNAGYCWSNFAVPSTPKEEVTKDWILKLKEICIRLNRCSGIDKNVGSCWRCQTCKEKIGEKQLRTIPADIGLRISLCSGKKLQVHCVLCERFSEPDECVWVPLGKEEALFYLCGSCSRSKSMDVKIAKFKSVLEFGRPLRSAPPSLPSKKKTTTKQQGKDEI